MQFGDRGRAARPGTVFATASGAAFVLDGDEVRPGRLDDAVRVAKLVHVSQNIELSADCIEPIDLPEELRTRRSTHARLTLSDKAIEWIASVDDDLDVAIALNEILFGAEWPRRPRALIILNTNSPLQLSGETARLLVRWARLGQPSCVTACVMGGTTGPATPAGTLVVQHAEVLAALVLAQAAARRLPVHLRRRVGDVEHADRRRALRYGGVRAARRRHRAPRTPRRPAGARRRRGHRRARAGCAGDARVGRRACRPVRPPAPTSCSRPPGALSSLNVLSLEKLVMDDEAIAMVRALQAQPPRPTRTPWPAR